MNKPAVVCFSHIKDNLENLISELQNYFGVSVEKSTFQEENFLLDSLKNFSNQEPKLFVIDVDDSTSETIRFIDSIEQNCPKSIKLIIAENDHLIQMQQQIENKGKLQFLNRHWTTSDINIALNIASQAYSKLPLVENIKYQELSFNEKVEKKVNEHLQKLIDANMAKDNFISIIAHDLKSPFLGLRGISDILLNDWETLSDKNKLELVGDIRKTSEDTYQLLENLLEWTKSQKEKLKVTINEVKIHNLVDTTIKITECNASVKRIKVKNKIDDDLKVNTDENMIATVFRNLISNAVQYTQPGGKINITAKEEKDYYTFCVADNGKGIDKPHILELFNRGKRKKLNGNASAFKGLGLIICKDFVEKNGGQIWLETQIGQGSKFFFTVPC